MRRDKVTLVELVSLPLLQVLARCALLHLDLLVGGDDVDDIYHGLQPIKHVAIIHFVVRSGDTDTIIL